MQNDQREPDESPCSRKMSFRHRPLSCRSRGILTPSMPPTSELIHAAPDAASLCNRDRKLDAQVERTKHRPLASGVMMDYGCCTLRSRC